jgi:hypothetical protein
VVVRRSKDVIGMDGCQVIERVADRAGSISPPRPLRKALLVVGMSRSGTSLLTHVLHTLGAALPRDLMGAGYGNPLGHFEPLGLTALNDEILRSLGRSWNDPRPIPASWFRSRAAYEFLEQVIALLRQSYGDAPLVVIKDPRLCRLLPLYLDALDVLDIEPLVILQVRPVAEVVQSLVDRDAMQPGLAEFLWLRSLVEAEWQSRNCPRVWVSMADMLADWPDVLCRIADGLRLEWPIGVEEAAPEIAALVKPRLYHRVEPEPGEDAVRRFCTLAWAATGRGLAGDEPAARAGFDAVRGVLQDLDRMYAPYVLAKSSRCVPWYRRLVAVLRGG